MNEPLPSYEAAMRDARAYLRRRDLSSQEEIPLYFAWQRLYAAANANLSTDFLQETHAEFRARREARLAPRRGLSPPFFTSFDKSRRTSAQASAFLRQSSSDAAIDMMVRRYRREAQKLRLSRDDLLNEVEKRRNKGRFRKKTLIVEGNELRDSGGGVHSETESETEKLMKSFKKRTKNLYQTMNSFEPQMDDTREALPVYNTRLFGSTRKLGRNWMVDDPEDESRVAVNPVKAVDLNSATMPSVSSAVNSAASGVQVSDWRMPSDLDYASSASEKRNVRSSKERNSGQVDEIRESTPVDGKEDTTMFNAKSRSSELNEKDVSIDHDTARSIKPEAGNKDTKSNLDHEQLITSKRADAHNVSLDVADDSSLRNIVSKSMNKAVLDAAFQQNLLEFAHAVGKMEVTIQKKQLKMTFTGAIEGETGDEESHAAKLVTEPPVKLGEIKQPFVSQEKVDVLYDKSVKEQEKQQPLEDRQSRGENALKKRYSVRFADDSSLDSKISVKDELLAASQARQDPLEYQNERLKQSSFSSVKSPAIDVKQTFQVDSEKQNEEESEQTSAPVESANEYDDSEEVVKETGRQLRNSLQHQRIDGKNESASRKQEQIEKCDAQPKGVTPDNDENEDTGLESDEDDVERIDHANCNLLSQSDSHEDDLSETHGIVESKKSVELSKNATKKTLQREHRHSYEQQITEGKEVCQNALDDLDEREGGMDDLDEREGGMDDLDSETEKLNYNDLQSGRLKQRSQHARNTEREYERERSFGKRVSNAQDISRDCELAPETIEDRGSIRHSEHYDKDHDEHMRQSRACDNDNREKLRESDPTRTNAKDIAKGDLEESAELDTVPKHQRYKDSVRHVNSELTRTRDTRRQADVDAGRSRESNDLVKCGRDSASSNEGKRDKKMVHEGGNEKSEQRPSRKNSATNGATLNSKSKQSASAKLKLKDSENNTQNFDGKSEDVNVDNFNDHNSGSDDISATSGDESVRHTSNKHAKQLRTERHIESSRLLCDEPKIKTKSGRCRVLRQRHNEHNKVTDNDIQHDEECTSDEDLYNEEELVVDPDNLSKQYRDRRPRRQVRMDNHDRKHALSQSKSHRPTLVDKRQDLAYDSFSDSPDEFDDRVQRIVDDSRRSSSAHGSRAHHSNGTRRYTSRSSKYLAADPSRENDALLFKREYESHSNDANRRTEKGKVRSTKVTNQFPEGIVWPPGMEKECIARLGLDGHHPIAPPGLEHLVTDEQWSDYWTWLHWYSSWQMWYLKDKKKSRSHSDKKPKFHSDKEERRRQPERVNEAEDLGKRGQINANWWVDVGSSKHKHRRDRYR